MEATRRPSGEKSTPRTPSLATLKKVLRGCPVDASQTMRAESGPVSPVAINRLSADTAVAVIGFCAVCVVRVVVGWWRTRGGGNTHTHKHTGGECDQGATCVQTAQGTKSFRHKHFYMSSALAALRGGVVLSRAFACVTLWPCKSSWVRAEASYTTPECALAQRPGKGKQG